MTYQPNIPLLTDELSTSQSDIESNFQALAPLINGLFDLPPQSVDPTPTGDNIIFAKTYTVTGNEEVYIQNSSASINYPITASNPIATGWTFLPSGILLKWGSATKTGLDTVSLAYGPVFTTVLATFLTPTATAGVNTNTMIYSAGTTPLALSVYGLARTGALGTTAATQFYYLVIGLGTGD